LNAHVSIRAIRKTYGSFEALKQVSLEIADGEFVTLLGPSGSGKTTLLQVIAGFVSPNSGSILIGGEELLNKPPHKRNIGMVFQNYALFPHMNVAENVAYPLKLRRISRAEVQARARKALDTVQLGEFMERSIDSLSGGQRQRVALARAIVFEPRILLMDEPLSALDKKLREQMQIELRHLQERLGTTTVFVTHDQREALTMSDRIAVINHGALIQVDGPRDIYERPRTRFVADFIGETTFLPVEVGEDGAARLQGDPLKLAGEQRFAAGAHWLALRPEKIRLRRGAEPLDDPQVNSLAATAGETIFQGDSMLLLAVLGDGKPVSVRLVAQEGNRLNAPEPGAAIRLEVHRNDTVVVAADG
jgi:putative spermidine/putrescine transport system ATP-binding protein